MRLGPPPMECPRCRAVWWSRRLYTDAKVTWVAGMFAAGVGMGFIVHDFRAFYVGEAHLEAVLGQVLLASSSAVGGLALVMALAGWIVGLVARRWVAPSFACYGVSPPPLCRTLSAAVFTPGCPPCRAAHSARFSRDLAKGTAINAVVFGGATLVALLTVRPGDT